MTGKKLSQLKPINQIKITEFLATEEKHWEKNRKSGKWSDATDDGIFARDMRQYYDAFIKFRNAVMVENADISEAFSRWVEDHSGSTLPEDFVPREIISRINVPQMQFLERYEDAVRYLDYCDEEDSRF